MCARGHELPNDKVVTSHRRGKIVLIDCLTLHLFVKLPN